VQIAIGLAETREVGVRFELHAMEPSAETERLQFESDPNLLPACQISCDDGRGTALTSRPTRSAWWRAP